MAISNIYWDSGLASVLRVIGNGDAESGDRGHTLHRDISVPVPACTLDPVFFPGRIPFRQVPDLVIPVKRVRTPYRRSEILLVFTNTNSGQLAVPSFFLLEASSYRDRRAY